MSENIYYEKIMQLDGINDIKNIVNHWKNFSKNRVNSLAASTIVLPDMLWCVKSGYGKTNLLKLVSEYLYSEKLMEFYGDVKYFEYVLEHKGNETNLIEEFQIPLINAAGFRDEFKGVVCIDISQWLNHLDTRSFLNFLNYLSENSNIWHIIFTVDSHKKEKVNRLEALLSVYFRIEKVVFNLPKTEKLGNFVEDYLKDHGFALEDEAKRILTETIEELRMGDYFDGYKTLEMICADLIYREFSSDDFNGYVITAETTQYYSKDSEFVKRTKSNIEKRNAIGFNTKDE